LFRSGVLFDGSLEIGLIEFISFFDDYDSVEKALFNHFNVDEDE
jgi:hypothetical protein